MQIRKMKPKKESVVYLVLWTILFIAPLLSTYIEYSSSNDTISFPWHDLWHIWKQYLLFLVVFLIHNYLLAPLLVYRRKWMLYISSITLLLSAFIVAQCIDKPDIPKKRIEPPFIHADRPPHHLEDNPEMPFFEEGDPEMPFFEEDGPIHRPNKMPEIRRGHRPPGIVREHDVVSTIIFLLMIGMNLGMKFYFRHRRDHERLATLERQNLEQQLEYLKYQINPHFLMNTLNNIHALVDIEPEQAKESIVELSKIMRFVLYEGSKQKVPLRQEIIFLDNYIQLMRIRVADQVDISVDIPQIMPEREIPPLMFITFVENAFKHGVSYKQHSFINIKIELTEDNHLHFCCSNSKVLQGEDLHGGVGLQNVKRRLELIYGKDYTLDIKDEEKTYTVNLTLPL